MKKEEAESEAQRREYEMDNTFCPLIREVCNKKCVCYLRARVENPHEESSRAREDGWRARGGYCNNGMFAEPVVPMAQL